jgi:hypothetical protein
MRIPVHSSVIALTHPRMNCGLTAKVPTGLELRSLEETLAP